jgi:hypothetical protein
MVPRRRRRRGRVETSPGPPEASATEARWSADLADFDPVEFAEFLDAEEGPFPVDPAFRERLRHQLWNMVRDRSAPNARDPGRAKPPRAPLPDPKPRR